ncbi:MAG TPA: PIG-L deacetylase family protein [Anaerolineaceae bacterium]|jgi:LmbE family N-acetylglucosaminyl deacetylase
MQPSESPAKPDLFAARRILCIQPHYDDNDLFAGGTIAALAERGAQILYLTVTDDLVGVLDQTHSDAQMTAQLRAEQAEAGAAIGVSQQYWLGYPDAGEHDYYRLRKDILGHLRRLQPDFVLTVDPWLPYEIHQDHILTGRAAAEAVFLSGFSRLKTDPETDRSAPPCAVQGIAFYNSAWPNLVIDISATLRRKRQAIAAYRAQFSPDDLLALMQDTETAELEAAEGHAFSHAEKLKIVHPAALHGNTRTWQS